jgi:argininosuccinate synthase
VTGTRSPASLLDRAVATYGEENLLWSGEEARGFARVQAVAPLLAARAQARAESILGQSGDK